MLRMSLPAFRWDPCSLAAVVGSRTCREVFAILADPNWKKWVEETIANSDEPREIDDPDLETLRVDVKNEEDDVHFDVFTPCNHEGPCTTKNCPCVIREAYCQPLCSCNCRRYSEGPSGTGIALVQNETNACEHLHEGCECESGGRNELSCPCWKSSMACESWCKCSLSTSKCNRLVTKK